MAGMEGSDMLGRQHGMIHRPTGTNDPSTLAPTTGLPSITRASAEARRRRRVTGTAEGRARVEGDAGKGGLVDTALDAVTHGAATAHRSALPSTATAPTRGNTVAPSMPGEPVARGWPLPSRTCDSQRRVTFDMPDATPATTGTAPADAGRKDSSAPASDMNARKTAAAVHTPGAAATGTPMPLPTIEGVLVVDALALADVTIPPGAAANLTMAAVICVKGVPVGPERHTQSLPHPILEGDELPAYHATAGKAGGVAGGGATRHVVWMWPQDAAGWAAASTALSQVEGVMGEDTRAMVSHSLHAFHPGGSVCLLPVSLQVAPSTAALAAPPAAVAAGLVSALHDMSLQVRIVQRDGGRALAIASIPLRSLLDPGVATASSHVSMAEAGGVTLHAIMHPRSPAVTPPAWIVMRVPHGDGSGAVAARGGRMCISTVWLPGASLPPPAAPPSPAPATPAPPVPTPAPAPSVLDGPLLTLPTASAGGGGRASLHSTPSTVQPLPLVPADIRLLASLASVQPGGEGAGTTPSSLRPRSAATALTATLAQVDWLLIGRLPPRQVGGCMLRCGYPLTQASATRLFTLLRDMSVGVRHGPSHDDASIDSWMAGAHGADAADLVDYITLLQLLTLPACDWVEAVEACEQLDRSAGADGGDAHFWANLAQRVPSIHTIAMGTRVRLALTRAAMGGGAGMRSGVPPVQSVLLHTQRVLDAQCTSLVAGVRCVSATVLLTALSTHLHCRLPAPDFALLCACTPGALLVGDEVGAGALGSQHDGMATSALHGVIDVDRLLVAVFAPGCMHKAGVDDGGGWRQVASMSMPMTADELALRCHLRSHLLASAFALGCSCETLLQSAAAAAAAKVGDAALDASHTHATHTLMPLTHLVAAVGHTVGFHISPRLATIIARHTAASGRGSGEAGGKPPTPAVALASFMARYLDLDGEEVAHLCLRLRCHVDGMRTEHPSYAAQVRDTFTAFAMRPVDLAFLAHLTPPGGRVVTRPMEAPGITMRQFLAACTDVGLPVGREEAMLLGRVCRAQPPPEHATTAAAAASHPSHDTVAVDRWLLFALGEMVASEGGGGRVGGDGLPACLFRSPTPTSSVRETARQLLLYLHAQGGSERDVAPAPLGQRAAAMVTDSQPPTHPAPAPATTTVAAVAQPGTDGSGPSNASPVDDATAATRAEAASALGRDANEQVGPGPRPPSPSSPVADPVMRDRRNSSKEDDDDGDDGSGTASSPAHEQPVGGQLDAGTIAVLMSRAGGDPLYTLLLQRLVQATPGGEAPSTSRAVVPSEEAGALGSGSLRHATAVPAPAPTPKSPAPSPPAVDTLASPAPPEREEGQGTTRAMVVEAGAEAQAMSPPPTPSTLAPIPPLPVVPTGAQHGAGRSSSLAGVWTCPVCLHTQAGGSGGVPCAACGTSNPFTTLPSHLAQINWVCTSCAFPNLPHSDACLVCGRAVVAPMPTTAAWDAVAMAGHTDADTPGKGGRDGMDVAALLQRPPRVLTEARNARNAPPSDAPGPVPAPGATVKTAGMGVAIAPAPSPGSHVVEVDALVASGGPSVGDEQVGMGAGTPATSPSIVPPAISTHLPGWSAVWDGRQQAPGRSVMGSDGGVYMYLHAAGVQVGTPAVASASPPAVPHRHGVEWRDGTPTISPWWQR